MEYRPLGAGANLDKRRVEREYGLCTNCYRNTWWLVDIERFYETCDGELVVVYYKRRRLRLCRACADLW